MPSTAYEQLVSEAVPRVIETDREYSSIAERFGELVRKGKRRAEAETQFMRLLGLLIEDYDRRHGLPPPKSTPAERLRFVLEHAGKTPADLAAIFGQRSHVNEVLNGKRRIGLDHARKLGKMFGVRPGFFV